VKSCNVTTVVNPDEGGAIDLCREIKARKGCATLNKSMIKQSARIAILTNNIPCVIYTPRNRSIYPGKCTGKSTGV
jgi:hypothetical protein